MSQDPSPSFICQGTQHQTSLVAQMVKNLPAMKETQIQSLGGEDSPGEGNDDPLQYSYLENSMDRGARWATVHRVTKNWTQLRNWHFYFQNQTGAPDMARPARAWIFQRGLHWYSWAWQCSVNAHSMLGTGDHRIPGGQPFNPFGKTKHTMWNIKCQGPFLQLGYDCKSGRMKGIEHSEDSKLTSTAS